MRDKKDLTLIEEKIVSHNWYVYTFQDNERNRYVWNTAKKYWFDKKEWWTLSFEVFNREVIPIEIKNVRVIKR